MMLFGAYVIFTALTFLWIVTHHKNYDPIGAILTSMAWFIFWPYVGYHWIRKWISQ